MDTLWSHFKDLQKSKFKNLSDAPLKNAKKRYIKRRLIEFVLGTIIILSGQNFLYAENFQLLLWPTTGVALSMLFLRGINMWIPIATGCLLAGVLQQWPLKANLISASAFTGYALICYVLSIRLIGAIQPVTQTRVLSKWFTLLIVCSLLFCTLLNAFLFQGNGLPIGTISKMSFLCMNGILPLTPLSLMLDPFTFQNNAIIKQSKWWIVTILLLGAMVFTLFFIPNYLTLMFALCLLGAPLFAWRYGQIPTGFTLLATATLFLGLPAQHWQHNPLLPILFMALGMISLMIGTIKYQQSALN